MRGKKIKVIAKVTIESLIHIFKKGDELTIQSILLDKPKLIHREIAHYCSPDNKPLKIVNPNFVKELKGKKLGERVELKNGNSVVITSEPKYRPIGEYNGFVIITSDGTEYDGESATYGFNLENLFEKVLVESK